MDPLVKLDHALNEASIEARQLPVNYQGRDLVNLLGGGQLNEGSEIKGLVTRIETIVKDMFKTAGATTATAHLIVTFGLLGQSEITSTSSIVTLRIAWLASQVLQENHCSFKEFLKKTKLEPNEQLRVLQFVHLIKICHSTEKTINYPKADFYNLINNMTPKWRDIFWLIAQMST